MIIDEINKAKLIAIKNKDEQAKIALGAIKNEFLKLQADKRAKNQEVTDADMVQALLKLSKQLDEEAEVYKNAGRMDSYNEIMEQKKTITSFLPKMLTIDEIKEIINTLPDKSVPFVMKHFKTNYAGRVNMQDVNIAIKSM